MDLLGLGGTSWLGGAVARDAVARGHRVTCLARGEAGTPPDGVTWVRADRREPGAYDSVADRDWHAVVDVSWQPDQVRSALAALTPRARHWVYVSSCSVYVDDATPDTDESAPLHPAHEGAGPVDIEVYGPAKVACERACVDALGAERVLLARAGLIAGYGDRSDRFGYWPARAARAQDGEPVLAPPGDVHTQVIDVDDLSAWLVHTAEQRVGGAFNAVGDPVPVRATLDASASAAGTRPTYREAADGWLTEQDVEPWAGPESLPLWLPQPDYAGFASRSNAAAKHAGLRLRPVADTAAAALAWERELGIDRDDRRAGLSPAREAELLERLDT
ncbi:MAG: oxidoreductase [Nocardioidaceae bacterium]|nr:oxidoreductase [Nocardioidaceae bacterium]